MAETQAFLDRRIDEVMRFEKAKARWQVSGRRFSLSRFLGRLRYPVGLTLLIISRNASTSSRS